MNEKPLNVLAVMNRALNQACGIAADHPRSNNLNNHVDDLREARAAVAELIEADKEYDAARNDVCKAAQTRGRHSSEAVSARHKLGNAIARRAAALARCGGAS